MAPRLSEIALAPLAPPYARERALMAEAAKCVERSAEEWYHRTRRKYGHSRLLLEPVILKPSCDDCLARLDLPTSLDRCWNSTKARDTEVVVLPEETRPERIAIYDRGKRLAYLWRGGSSPEWWPGVQCSDCRQTIDHSDDIFAVYEEPFAEYFGLPDPQDAPKSLRGSTKKKVRETRDDLRRPLFRVRQEAKANAGPFSLSRGAERGLPPTFNRSAKNANGKKRTSSP